MSQVYLCIHRNTQKLKKRFTSLPFYLVIYSNIAYPILFHILLIQAETHYIDFKSTNGSQFTVLKAPKYIYLLIQALVFVFQVFFKSILILILSQKPMFIYVGWIG